MTAPWRCPCLTLALAVLCAPVATSAGESDRALAVSIGYETARLPGGERLGLAHADLLFEVAPDWWLGPTVYGAASGQRGGFFVGGLAVQRPVTLGSGVWLVPALAFGGGGGGAAPVGKGLMLRPSLALQLPVGPWRAGLAVSELHFPGTGIRSTQLAFVAEWQGLFVAQPLSKIGQPMAAEGRSGLGFDRVALTAGRLSLRGTTTGAKVDLIGLRLDRLDAAGPLYWGLDAAAAANGSNAGYMELLGHGGVEIALAGGLRVGARLALGLAGGGAVPTGAGPLGRLDATLQLALAPGWRLGASLGRSAGSTAAMRGSHAELSLATDLEPGEAPAAGARLGTVRRIDWTGGLEQLGAVDRKDGTRRPLQTLGLQIDWWTGPHGYLTGQALSALGGGAGAYSQGLLGAGVATAAQAGSWQFGAELAVGAGGGGGVHSLAGALAKSMLWAAWQSQTGGAHARAGLGVEAGRQGAASPVLGLGWVVPFGQVVR